MTRDCATEIPPLGTALKARQAEPELRRMLLEGNGVLVRRLEREGPGGGLDAQPEAVEVAGVARTEQGSAAEEWGRQQVPRDPVRLSANGACRSHPPTYGGNRYAGRAASQEPALSESTRSSTIRTSRRHRSITCPSCVANTNVTPSSRLPGHHVEQCLSGVRVEVAVGSSANTECRFDSSHNSQPFVPINRWAASGNAFRRLSVRRLVHRPRHNPPLL